MKTLIEYLNNHHNNTRENKANFSTVEELIDSIGEQEVLDVIEDYCKQQKPSNKSTLVDVYVNGSWDTSLEDKEDKTVIIYELGMVYQMDSSKFNSFVDKLEEEGFDCYLCPQLFSHPDWNGIIKYELE